MAPELLTERFSELLRTERESNQLALSPLMRQYTGVAMGARLRSDHLALAVLAECFASVPRITLTPRRRTLTEIRCACTWMRVNLSPALIAQTFAT